MPVKIHGIGKRIILMDMETNMEIIELKNQFGDVLKGRKWEVKNPKANIILMEGMEEYCLRYDEFAKLLNKNGFSVYALDVYGQGLNILEDHSNEGVWPKDAFDKQIDSTHELIEKYRNGLPTYMFSHSMGSYMSQWFIQKYPNDLEKIIICGSGAKNPAAGFGFVLASMISTKKKKDVKAKMLKKLMFGSFNKTAKIKDARTEYDWLSYNEENVDKYIRDPLCGYGSTNNFCKEFLRGIKNEYKIKNLKNINKDLKIFLISGDNDPVTHCGKDTVKLDKMYKKLGVKDVSMKIYPHMRHELLNEKDIEPLLNELVEFYLK